MRNLIIFLLLLILLACNNLQKDNKTEQVTIINIADVISAESSVDFDEIVKGDKLIKLEKTENSIVGNIWKLMVCDDKIYIQDNNKTLFVFDTEGKLITKINAVGRGPNEYVELSDFDIDSSTGNIKILDETTGTILIFNEAGQIIKTVKAPHRGVNLVSIKNINYIYTPLQMSGDREAGNEIVSRINDSGIETREYLFATPFKNAPYLMFASTMVDNENKLFKIPFNDTIYRAGENEITPEFILDFGNKGIPQELYDDTQEYRAKKSNYIEFASLHILDDYYFTFILYKDKYYRAILSRKTNSTLLLQGEDNGRGIFYEKFGIDIWPAYTSGNAAYFVIDPYKLSTEKIKTDFGITITENDNPLIYMITL